MAVAQTIGIEMPADFPTTEYNAVNAKLAQYQPIHPILWSEYASSWNAVAIRFRTAADADERFSISIKRAGASHDQRQDQEQDLFTFFVAGMSAIESFAYSAFSLGAMLQPTNFPMATDKDLKAITPTFATQKFLSHFSSEALSTSFSALLADATFAKWYSIRNVLAHRSAPRRMHRVGGSSNKLSSWDVTGGLPLNDRTTKIFRAWLAPHLTKCVQDMDAFSKVHFP